MSVTAPRIWKRWPGSHRFSIPDSSVQSPEFIKEVTEGRRAKTCLGPLPPQPGGCRAGLELRLPGTVPTVPHLHMEGIVSRLKEQQGPIQETSGTDCCVQGPVSGLSPFCYLFCSRTEHLRSRAPGSAHSHTAHRGYSWFPGRLLLLSLPIPAVLCN